MARDYKREYRLFQSSPEMLEYRAELNKINRNNPNSVKGDKKGQNGYVPQRRKVNFRG
jgi:hypothetical protein